MGYLVIYLPIILIIIAQGFPASSSSHHDPKSEVESLDESPEASEEGKENKFFKTSEVAEETTWQKFVKFVKDWVSTFKLGFAFTSKPGMNLFMRFNTRENFSNIGPGTYNVSESFKAVTSKIFSRKGYGGLIRTTCVTHTEDYPAPNEYNISNLFTKIKETKYPFSSTVKRNMFNINTNPGPGVYQIPTSFNRRTMFEDDFGRGVRMRLPVEIKCCKRNLDICDICNQKPIGDYWHLNNRKFLCRPCMINERRKSAKYKIEKLKNYRKIRDCSWIHSHEGTDAKIWLMHPKIIQSWAQKEAYMCSYIND
ncbi:hypothetical protein PV328_000199 [Microctonus aethiopoides]|uniref:Uncharacterized protein n=1 Tax=Microctonus aethiopoides TaxID=144406 RepID=A0AA39KW64_9HYME|nr:hypothetical protein PV328_000199 [Microctonus aethiopoides]